MAKMAFSLEEAPCGSTGLLHSSREYLWLEVVTLHLPPEGGAIHPEFLRSLTAIPAMLSQDIQDFVSLVAKALCLE
jgi:hypothetical protein